MKNYFVELVYADGQRVVTMDGGRDETLYDFNAWKNSLENGEIINWGVTDSDDRKILDSYSKSLNGQQL